MPLGKLGPGSRARVLLGRESGMDRAGMVVPDLMGFSVPAAGFYLPRAASKVAELHVDVCLFLMFSTGGAPRNARHRSRRSLC